MKKRGLIILAILAAVLICMTVFVHVAQKPAKMSKNDLTIVTAPDQEEAEENERFTIIPYEPPVIDGTNVAPEGRAISNGETDVYAAANSIDGSRDGGSYWEGPTTGPSELTVNLKSVYNLHTAVIGLNPNSIWGPRTQTLSISVSEDGKNYTEVVPEADFEFDPKTGNEVVFDLGGEVKAQFVKVVITKNTGAGGGQIAELELYTNDK